MEIGARHWLIVIFIAMLMHAYAIWNLNFTGDFIETDLLTQYTIDLTTFKAAPEPIKLKPFIPPPPKEVKALKPEIKPETKPKPKPKPKVVAPKFEQPVTVKEPEPIESVPVQAPKVAKVTPSVTPSRSQAEINLEKANYYQLILKKLERFKKYPSRARRRGEQGTVRLTFSLNQDGSLHSHEITKSSGSRALDREVEQLIVRASPFPPIPEIMGTGKLELSVPISFTLHQ